MAERPSTLFRQEALQARAARLDGDVILAQPLRVVVLVIFLLAIAGTAIGFLSTAGYARTERVSGYLQPDIGLSTILPSRPGTVLEVRAKVGDLVRKGDILVQVGSASTLASGLGLEEDLQRGIEAQRAELAGKRDAAHALFERQRERKLEEIDALEHKATHLGKLRAVAQQRLAIALQRSERSAALLAKGVISESAQQETHDLALSLEKEVQELAAASIEHTDARNRLKAELESMPLEDQQRDAALGMQLLELEGRLREIEARSSYSILAPVAGRLAVLQARVGTLMVPGVPVAVVIPEHARFEAVLLVPTRASGMIQTGQRVGIKYEAFPYQEFGVQTGQIVRIDTAILSASEVSAPLQVTEPVYRVTAELAAQHVRALGRPYPLQSGMRFEAEIVLETRSFLAWILEPVYKLRGVPVSPSSGSPND